MREKAIVVVAAVVAAADVVVGAERREKEQRERKNEKKRAGYAWRLLRLTLTRNRFLSRLPVGKREITSRAKELEKESSGSNTTYTQ